VGSEVTKSEGQVRDIKGKITERSETGNKKRKKKYIKKIGERNFKQRQQNMNI
jgi:hypothetical protein